MENMQDLLLRFKTHLLTLNRSRETIASYHGQVQHFLSALPVKDARKVNRSMIEEYLKGLYQHRTKKGTAYKTGSICLKVRSIKRFFEFLEQANIIFSDPSELIREPPKGNRVPKKILSREETLNVMDQPNLGTRLGIRDRAILEVFDSTGIRVNELSLLSVFDADLTGRLLKISSGKGKKDRVVPLGKHAAKFLREYLLKVRPHYTKKNRPERGLFVDRTGHVLKKESVSVLVKKYGQRAGLKRLLSPHMFRHGFATALIKNGADVVSVQKMLGHAQLRTTQGYIDALGLDLKKAHQKSHPREKDKEEPFVKPRIKRRVAHA